MLLSVTTPSGAAAHDAHYGNATPDDSTLEGVRNAADGCRRQDERVSYLPDRPAAASEVFGYSSEGRPLLAEHYGSYNGPQLLVVGQVHGNECSPALLVARLRTIRPQGWGLYLIPTLNPDGLRRLERRASGIDLNRDGMTLQAPESRALMAFTTRHHIKLTIHLHSPMGWLGYHNGQQARALASALDVGSGLTPLRALVSEKGYLWEGQAVAAEGHQAVLLEIPAVIDAEAPRALERQEQSFDSVNNLVTTITRNLAAHMQTTAQTTARTPVYR